MARAYIPKKTINNNTNTKLKKILKKKPIINTNMNVIHTTKSKTKSYNIKSKSNHHKIKS